VSEVLASGAPYLKQLTTLLSRCPSLGTIGAFVLKLSTYRLPSISKTYVYTRG
jgi:hypothetical protein